ncbi:MAG: hypothetical protein KUG77_11255 [Nannocystaceae bacterium]|nr:hypothetical protein [Nannocystaceae bacterium]
MTRDVLQDEKQCAAFEMFHDGPIIVQRIRPYATMDVAAAEETLRRGRLMVAGQKIPLLVDLRAPCSVDVAARPIFAAPETGQIFSAVALLAANIVTRLAANLLLKVNQPPYPIRMFSDDAQARSWLSEYLEN